jgi:hypothetical protein
VQLAPALDRKLSDYVPAWAAAAGLIAVTTAVGPILGSAARPIFIIGCGAVGIYGWKRGPAAHFQAILILFCFASLARRMVDLTAGFDGSGLMLVGPLLAIMAPLSDLLTGRRSDFRNVQVLPMGIVFACVVYATFLTVFQGEWNNAASNAVKSIAPLIYVLGLVAAQAPRDEMVEAATSAFLFILPLMGLYGVYQYVDPPAWDRYWMQSASILSAGLPLPFEVRTFSVMNGPASFATFSAVGLMLVFFLRPGILPMLMSLPAAIALMLSMYRTAWISLAIGIAFCLLFSATRLRAGGTLAGIAVMIVIALMTPFGDVISDRFASLSNGAGDGSARERLEEFASLWVRPDSGMIGSGYSTVDVGSAGSMAVDGMFITCWLSMGLIVGLVCIGGLFLAIGNAVAASWIDRRATSIVIGALALGALTQMPLANIISGELGFLFWAFIVLVTSPITPTGFRLDQNA